MILDYLKNYKLYAPIVPRLEEGMAFAESLKTAEPGRYEGKNGMYANVQEGDTYDITDDRIETHRKYLDVQIVCRGREIFQWEEAGNLEVETPYDEETDFIFYKGEGKPILATKDMFYVLFPQDAHKCRGMVGQSGEPYRKIVLKLPVE